MSGMLCAADDMHPYHCLGPGKCQHCDRTKTDQHQPATCALCDETPPRKRTRKLKGQRAVQETQP